MKHLTEIVARFADKRVVVVGDAIADQFLYGEISRVSREAPVFILRHEHTETSPGGAANCALNLASLGAHVSLISVVGDDEPGKSLLEKLRAMKVDCEGVMVSADYRTTTKVRVLAGQIHSTRQQVIRIDYDGEAKLSAQISDRLKASVNDRITNADAVVISDYNYGAVDPEIAGLVRDAAHARGIPALIDSRFRLSSFQNFTAATPNEDEVEELLGAEHTDVTSLESSAKQLREQLGYQALLVTRGSHGMMLIEDGGRPLHIGAVGASEPVDPTGAGDTVMATYALAVASGASFADAASLANFAGGLVVMKRGTATVTASELLASIANQR
jgi:D-glycero-beta-D-manno-heptose-7-phosphate kinase